MNQQNNAARANSRQTFVGMRDAMVVGQLRTVAVNDPRVIAVLKRVAREAFVPSGRAGLAYTDSAIPLGEGRALNTPLATARLIIEAGVQRADTVLLVGAATGYAAALLSDLAGQVVAVEESSALLAIAKQQLKAYNNVKLVDGALPAGAKKHGPFDVIMIDGAVEVVPENLVAQLKVGGRLVTGLIENGVQRLAYGRKTAGGFGLVPFLDAACVVLPGFTQPKVFTF
jgi:protein-L-isoaspartate(D-aspartate) O-methyltransferase